MQKRQLAACPSRTRPYSRRGVALDAVTCSTSRSPSAEDYISAQGLWLGALEASGGQKIVIGSNGIEITDGQGGTIKVNGGRVTVNDGALEVV